MPSHLWACVFSTNYKAHKEKPNHLCLNNIRQITPTDSKHMTQAPNLKASAPIIWLSKEAEMEKIAIIIYSTCKAKP